MEFYRPLTIEEAVGLLDRLKENALIVNGGTDTIPALTEGKSRPEAVVYIGDIPELKTIRCEDGLVRLGGAVTYASMEKDVRTASIRGLSDSLRRLGSPPIRAAATAAGNIGRGATAADCSTMLTALCAEVVLKSAGGERTMPLPEVFTGPFQTAIRPQELITEIRFPALKAGEGTAYVKYSRRQAQDIGKILTGVRLRVENGICTESSISLGAVNRTIVRSRDTEKRILGRSLKDAQESIRSSRPAEAVLRDSYFRHYKELAVSEAVCEAVTAAWEDAEQSLAR